MSVPMRFGVNYVPRAGWMHWWLDPDFEASARDFDTLAQLGVDHVRVFPIWPYIQPNRAFVRPAALEQLRRLVTLAAERGIDTTVDALQGHMSSFDFLPAWLTAWHDRNVFTDPVAIDGQRRLVTALGETLSDLPTFLGLTIGNEFNQFSGAPHPTPQPCTSTQAEAWLDELLVAAQSAAPGRVHTHSEYDAVWYLDDHPFTPAHAARLGDITTIHSWIFNGTAQQYGGLSSASIRHAEYLIELARAFQVDPGRQLWLQEAGAPLNCLAEDDAPAFAEETVRAVARCSDVWGVTWWCSHDVNTRFVDFPELEYTLGLVDAQGNIKPIGKALAAAMGDLRDDPPVPVSRSTAIVVDVDSDDLPVARTALGPGGAVFETWLRLVADGVDPAFVLSSQLDDTAALDARGITEVV